jgi:hypothetical protein
MGAKVIMVNRKQEQGNEAIAKIKESYKKEKGAEGGEAKIEWKGCDLGKLSNVQEVFGGFAKDLDRLDLVSRPSLCCSGMNG